MLADIRKTFLLPNIRDDAINAILGLTKGNLSYATYTQLINDFLRMSRQADDLPCVRFISELANFQLQTQGKSHHSEQKGYS
jgi:hypothetical protein